MGIFDFAPLSERVQKIARFADDLFKRKSYDEPAYPLGRRVKKIRLFNKNVIRQLTNCAPAKQVPVGTLGTVIEATTAYIHVQWDGVPVDDLLPNPFSNCYDPVEQVWYIEPAEE